RKRSRGVAVAGGGRWGTKKRASNRLSVWDPRTGQALDAPPRVEDSDSLVALSLDGTAVALVGIRTVHVWGLQSGKKQATLPVHAIPSTSAAAFSPDGARLLIATRSNSAELWDLATQNQAPPPSPRVRGSTAATVPAQGRTLWTGARARRGRLWDAQRGTPLTPPLVRLDEVTAVSMSPDGRVVGTTCAKGFTYLWEATTGRAL